MSTQPETPSTNPPTDPPAAPPAAPPAQNQPPAAPPSPPAAQNPPDDARARADAHAGAAGILDAKSLTELRTEIQALPEKMVHAYREAFQPPQNPPSPPAAGGANSGTPTPGAGKPNQTTGERFRNWWFGG